MATILNLPTFAGLYHYKYRLDFDGDNITRTVEIHFSPRDDTAAGTDGAWSMDLVDAKGDVLVRGVKLSIGRDKLRRYRHIRGMPTACLHVVDTTGTGKEPTSTSFGSDVVLQIERP